MGPVLVVGLVLGFLWLFSKTVAITLPVGLLLCGGFLWMVSRAREKPPGPR